MRPVATPAPSPPTGEMHPLIPRLPFRAPMAVTTSSRAPGEIFPPVCVCYMISNNAHYKTKWNEILSKRFCTHPHTDVNYIEYCDVKYIQFTPLVHENYYYFFNALFCFICRYWKYDAHARLQSGYPKDIRGAWLSCGIRTPR